MSDERSTDEQRDDARKRADEERREARQKAVAQHIEQFDAARGDHNAIRELERKLIRETSNGPRDEDGEQPTTDELPK